MSAEFNEALLNLSSHPLMWGLARMARRVGPVWRVPGLGILVSDASMAHEILRRDQDFTKNGEGSFADALTTVLGPVALGNMDGEKHLQLRKSISGVLTPSRANTLVDGRRSELDAMRAELQRGEPVDVVDFIRCWSGRIAFDLVGIPPPAGREQEASREIVKLSVRMASALGFGQLSNNRARAALIDCERLAAYFRDGYDSPAMPVSLVSELRDLGMSFEQARGLLLIFVIGGTLTVSAALPRIVALLVDKQLLGILSEEPGRIPGAIDEGLRYTAPLPGTVRIASRDVEVQGTRFAQGARLVILTCNLARDRRAYPDPDRFDITRDCHPKFGRLWYGAGPHRCAGINLAQRELQAVLEALTGLGAEIRIVERRAEKFALLPAWSSLVIQASGGRD